MCGAGTIPSKWNPYLETLDFINNKLSGTIPTSVGQLARLQLLHLYNNRLWGAGAHTHTARTLARVRMCTLALHLSLSRRQAIAYFKPRPVAL